MLRLAHIVTEPTKVGMPAMDEELNPRQLLEAILDSPIRHAILVTDLRGRVQVWNKGASRIFQYADEEILGGDVRKLFTPEDAADGIPDEEMADACRSGCAGDFRWHARKDGTLFWADGLMYPAITRDGVHLGYVKILRDATEEKTNGDATSRLALEDSLTGLPNRAEFHKRYIDMAASAQRHGRPLILLLLDLDGFKRVNDCFGHSAGDALLQQAAMRMRSVLRDTDFVARLGGDEFVVLQPDAASASDGATVAKNLITELAKPFTIDERELRIGASIGVSVYPDDAGDLGTLFINADLALYRAKSRGRGCYQYFADCASGVSQVSSA